MGKDQSEKYLLCDCDPTLTEMLTQLEYGIEGQIQANKLMEMITVFYAHRITSQNASFDFLFICKRRKE